VVFFPLQRSNDHLSYKTTFSKQKGQPYMEATVSNPEETTTEVSPEVIVGGGVQKALQFKYIVLYRVKILRFPWLP
jgi:hypothetical protein